MLVLIVSWELEPQAPSGKHASARSSGSERPYLLLVRGRSPASFRGAARAAGTGSDAVVSSASVGFGPIAL